MRRILLTLLIMPATSVRAANTADIYGKMAQKITDPELRRMTASVLRSKGDDYNGKAVKNMADRGEIFDHARVEVTGFMSNDKTDPELVDPACQIKPSFSVKDGGLVSAISAPVSDALKKIFPVIKNGELAHDADLDFDEVKKAMRGEVTDRARIKLQAYKNKEVNEILAHSWGTELVYAAILNGELRPPKRLIVVGVPDDDFAKWEMLAARTGTEVHWVRAANDKVALGGAKLAKEVAGKVDFKAKWDALCSDSEGKRSCPAHFRTPKPVIREKIPNIPGIDWHARTEYYALLKGKVIKSKFKELIAEEEAAKGAELQKIKNAALSNAVIEARGLIAQAREQQLEIARRDHDERLKNTYAAIARRSCANPGSVSQTELDRLGNPYDKDLTKGMPGDLDSCSLMVYMSLEKGVNAESIRKMSTQETVTAAQPLEPSPQAIQPLPRTPAGARATPPPPLSTVLPKLRDFAITACGASAQNPAPYFLREPYDYSYKEYDDNLAKDLAAGLGECPRQLFDQILGKMRSGQGMTIDNEWVQNLVAAYSRAPDTAPGPAAPPQSRGRRCEDYGNIRCP